GQFPDFPGNYEGRVKKGEYLRTLMPLNNAQATQENGASIVSPFQDPKDAAQWGWSLQTEWYPFKRATSTLEDLERELSDPSFRINMKQSGLYFYHHDQAFTQANGEKGQPTRATYSNLVNPYAGALIFNANISPEYMFQEYGRGTVPSLNRLSDFAFFQWIKGCQYKKVNPGYLRFVFRMNITYKPTRQVIMDALKEAGYTRVPGWGYHAKFKTGTRQGDAILGTTHGAGVAWMLIQHKDALGVKEIDEVAVWGHLKAGNGDGFEFRASPDSFVLNVRFTIKN
ncbi:hypothetical protein LZ32DRAFT_503643, partial [Colletotrichum eremochloae]